MLQNIKDRPGFTLHKGVEDLGLNHLCFADDLLMFCHGDKDSVELLMSTLDCFKSFSGLQANPQKSTCFLSHPPPGFSDWVVNSFGIPIGCLPAKFLGVPLISKKLSKQD